MKRQRKLSKAIRQDGEPIPGGIYHIIIWGIERRKLFERERGSPQRPLFIIDMQNNSGYNYAILQNI